MSGRLLTEKQKRFIDYFIKSGNQSEAAKLAGYKKPNVQGAQNLEKLRSEIDQRLGELESERIAGATEVLKYLTAVLRGEQTEPVVVVEGDGDGCSSARIVEKGISAKDRLKAAELLAKRYGLLVDNVHLSGDMGVQILNDIPKDTG